jgi:hypothetical protein
MQWLHASYGIGITLGPLIMTTGLNLFGAWRVGYVVVGAAQLMLAACFALTTSRWKQAPTVTTQPSLRGTKQSPSDSPEIASQKVLAMTQAEQLPPTSELAARRLTDYKTPLRETLRQPIVWLSMALFFIYVGIEISLGQWAYTLLTESRHIAPQVAGIMVGGLGHVYAGPRPGGPVREACGRTYPGAAEFAGGAAGRGAAVVESWRYD